MTFRAPVLASCRGGVAGRRVTTGHYVPPMSGDTGTALLDSERTFTVWSYTVSHSTLLLRSVKPDPEARRVDVLFKGVERMDLPSRMDGLRITGDDGAYRLSGVRWTGSVTALMCAVREDTGGYVDPSPFRTGRPVDADPSSVATRDDLADFVQAALADHRRDGHVEWENSTLDGFLEGFAAFAAAREVVGEDQETASWRLFAQMIAAATGYE